MTAIQTAAAPLAPPAKRRRRSRRSGDNATLSQALHFGPFAWVFVLFMAALAIIPVVELVNIALKTPAGFQKNPLGFTSPTLTNLRTAWTDGDYLRGYLVSGFIAAVTAAVVCITTCAAAYALVFLKFRGKETLFSWYLVAMALPFAMFLVPLFFAYQRIGLMDSVAGLTLLYCGIFSPFATLLMRSFMSGLPESLRESAQLDGAGEWRTWWSIFVPLTLPMMATIGALVAIWSWNEFFFANAFIQSASNQPVSLRYLVFSGNYASNWPAIMAAGLISLAPVAVLYLVAQRKIVTGLTAGSAR